MLGVVSIVGQDLADFDKPYNALVRNQVAPLLINNSATGKNVSIVIHKKDLPKAVNVIHGGDFLKSLSGLIWQFFGRGTVGNTLIQQIFQAREDILKRRNINLQIISVADSKQFVFDPKGISTTQYDNFAQEATPYTLNEFIWTGTTAPSREPSSD